ncbi:glycosyltransferase family 61 protein [Mariniflexile sp.]|uniref:glycosyltransferase family 61 protein n=1 Tax=Mariniflexile sp. TaxID=1979402 RepID=UPI0035696AB8
MIQQKTRFTLAGYTKYLKGIKTARWLFRQGKLLDSLSIKSWDIAPGTSSMVSQAYYLEGQLDRVTATAVTGDPNLLMLGGNERYHPPTRAYLLKDLWMINGNIYKGLHQLLLHPRYQLPKKLDYIPPIKIATEIDHAAIYNSYDGYKAFGIWLSDDCTMYPLAAAEGTPVTSDIFASPHMRDYRRLLHMTPFKTNAAYLKNAVFFDDDWGNNTSKHERFMAIRHRLLSQFPASKHPGVFIIRGNSGNSRVMLNEEAMAEQLRESYGFKIVDINKHSVSEILGACAGAQVLVGVEGSHLMHGLMVLEPGTALLTLQPPNRFCGVLKMTTDMEHIHYGFVVGIPKEEGFFVNLEEVKRTLALFPSTPSYH